MTQYDLVGEKKKYIHTYDFLEQKQGPSVECKPSSESNKGCSPLFVPVPGCSRQDTWTESMGFKSLGLDPWILYSAGDILRIIINNLMGYSTNKKDTWCYP